jgi:hypothetical protein
VNVTDLYSTEKNPAKTAAIGEAVILLTEAQTAFVQGVVSALRESLYEPAEPKLTFHGAKGSA